MSRRIAAALVLAVLLLLLVGLKLRYRGRAPLRLSSRECDAELWTRVYQKERLQVIEPCTAVEGRIRSVHAAGDGDLHLSLEPDDVSVLNLLNVAHTKRTLVVEIVCHHPAAQAAEQAPCAGYNSQIAVPEAGDRVRVTGAYVTDRDNGWREIHPVSRIEVLP